MKKKKILGLFIRLIILAFIGFAIFTPNETKNAPKGLKRALNQIDTPEEIPEISYNTYYLLTWHSTNASFIAPSNSGVKYILNDAWNFATFPEDTLFISTHDNDILTKQQFMETYEERDVRISRSSDRKLIVPYMGTYIEETATEENYNILISMNEFQYNTDYRFLNITNGLGSYNISTYWSLMNADETIDNEFLIKWGQPMLLLESETFTHSVNTTLTIQAFIQPISIKYNNGNALELKYMDGYNDGYNDGYRIGEDAGFENAKNQITGLVWVEETLKVTQRFLDIRFFPNITLGHLVGGVLIVELVIWFIRWWR